MLRSVRPRSAIGLPAELRPRAGRVRAALRPALALVLLLAAAPAAGQVEMPGTEPPAGAFVAPEAAPPATATGGIGSLETAIAGAGNDPEALRALATELVRVGRIDEASRLIERALALEEAPVRVYTMALATVLLIGLCLGFFVALRALRPGGDLAVAIEYPLDRRGSFNVRLARRASGRKAGTADDLPVPAVGTRASSRFEHTLVGRETQFRGIPARTYFVQLEGSIEEADGRATVFHEEREVFVGKRQSQRVEFDLRPKDCPVEVHVLRRGLPAADAKVVLRGDAETLIRAKEGATRLSLPPGSYQVAVGFEDRVAERALQIESLDGQTLTFDMDDSSGLVFRSCEAAVTSYLEGDDLAAANALERAGQRNVAHLLRAETHRVKGEFESAAIHYEAAGRLLEAAEVHTEAGASERAAVLFERAGDPVRAAEMHQASGDLVRAARCFEEAGDLKQAVECYREAGAIPKLMEVLEKVGDHFEAGRLAYEREEKHRAVRNLQQVDPRHPEYTRACRIMAETFIEEDKVELAVQKADEAITFASDDDVSKETFVWYGDLLERAGRTERALRVFQDLAEREPEDDDIRSRIHQLEEKYSKEQIQAAVGQGGAEPGAPAGRDLKRYELLSEIGRGGMGIVYKARDRRLGRIVALKRMPDNLKDHPRAVKLFLREARSAAALNHPNIVTVHDVDQEGGVYILTMELLKGAAFHNILKKRGRLSPADVSRLGIQIAQGLEYAHTRGIVHRDVKTANLFFTNDKVVKIMDFGLAKMLDELRRSATQITGTPYYMAPEQAAGGGGVDHRVDLYAFGVTLFELLTGELPFTDGDILFQHKEAPPPDPREIQPSIPEPLAGLVLKLMSKAPADRGASAAEVGTSLQRITEQLLAR